MKKGEEVVGLGGSLWFQKSDQKFIGSDRILLLEKIDELGSITKAAKALGISYRSAWDTVNLINNLAEAPIVEPLAGGKGGGGTRLTLEGKRIVSNYLIVQEEHRKYLANLEQRLGDISNLKNFLGRISMKVSARNVFAGIVSAIARGPVNAEVSLTLKGGATLVAIVTNGAIDNLGLQVGLDVYAIVKASSIIIGSDLQDVRISTRNIFCGTVTAVMEGPVNTEVKMEIGGGNTINAVITRESSTALDLKTGSQASAIFEASSVILGIS